MICTFSVLNVFANEPLWTEKERASKRDIVVDGEVKEVKKSHNLKNYKWSEVWSANIEISKSYKGADSLVGKDVLVYFERGTFIKNREVRHSRCPDFVELIKNDKAKFHLVKCTKAHLKRLELNETQKNVLLIEMDSDIIKSKR